MGHSVHAPLLLTREEVAERLRLSLVSIDRLRRSRELETVKMGRAVRIPLDSVVAFLARQEVRS